MTSASTEEMLAMFLLIQAAKEAVEKFEAGEVNVRDAVRLIRDATVSVRAAA